MGQNKMEEEVHQKLRVLTLNCWGIPIVSKDVKKRFTYIAKELSTGKYDIVSLQEVWSRSDYNYVCEKVAEVLPYTFYFDGGIIGCGVCVFSKYPITDTFTYTYSLNGYLYMVHHGDWFGGKSAGYCLIDHPRRPIHLFTTHLHAEYNHENDRYLSHRTVQAFQLSGFIQHLTKPSDCVIVCGDMNSEPVDPCYRVIRYLPGLIDTWAEIHGEKKESFEGNTCNVSSNSYAPHELDKEMRGGPKDGKRIDYIFYRSPPNSLKCIECQTTMGRIPGEDLSYSDHEGVLATFDMSSQAPLESPLNVADQKGNLKIKQEILNEVMNITQDGIDSISSGKITTYIIISFLVIFIFSPIFCTSEISSVFHITKVLGKMLYFFRVLCTMLFTGMLYYVIVNSKYEKRAYRNVQNEVKLQLKYPKP